MSPDVQRLRAIVAFRLTTADLPRLRRFYQEVLGFTVVGPEQAIAPEEIALLGLRGTGRRQSLRLGRQKVDIDQFDPPGRPYPADSDAASLWFQHFAIVVANMAEAYRRLDSVTPISEGGPQHLPLSSGGVQAFKFRDPDGHPLELLEFPPDRCPEAWQGRPAGQIILGIDHSAISVADAEASVAFYAGFGLRPGERTLNQGPDQQRLDGLKDVQVTVVPMQPPDATPHLELLGYQMPRGAGGPALAANDTAATRVVWHGTRSALVRDPDGHLHQIEPLPLEPRT